jgi:hypothetical protein
MHVKLNNNVIADFDKGLKVFNPISLKRRCCILLASQLYYRSEIYDLKEWLPKTVRVELSKMWHKYFIINSSPEHELERLEYQWLDFLYPLSPEDYTHILHSGGVDFSRVILPCSVIIKYYYTRVITSRPRSSAVSRRYCHDCFDYLRKIKSLPNNHVWDYNVRVVEIYDEPDQRINRRLRDKKMWCENCVLQCLLSISDV